MLRLVDGYIIREIIPYVLLALILLTAIIFVHDASRFSELLVVASRNGLPMRALGRVLAALIPGIVVFTLPISLLVGVLVALGRLSGDSEIVALGAIGVSRNRVLKATLALSLVVTVAMIYITFNMMPQSVNSLIDLKANQSLVIQGLNAQIKPRVFEESIPRKVLYIEDIDRASNEWRNIFLVDLEDGRGEFKIFTAESGALKEGQRSEMPELYLRGGSSHQAIELRADHPQQIDPKESTGLTPDLDQGPNGTRTSQSPAQPEIRAGSENGERTRRARQHNYNASYFDEMTLGLEVGENGADEAMNSRKEQAEIRTMVWNDLIAYTPPESERREWLVEIHKRLALPGACIVFALLGVGFGISKIRTGRSFGLLLGLALTITYYLLALTGEHAAISGKLPVWLGVWLANLVLAAVGVLVLIIQRRPGADALTVLRSLRYALKPAKLTTLPNPAPVVPDHRGNPARFDLATASEAAQSAEDSWLTTQENGSPNNSSTGLLRAQLIDKLVLSDLTRFFVFVLTGFTALFIVITLFQLLNHITRHNIEWAVVANYLLFLAPMVINYMTPLAALVAVLVTYGVLQKTSQVVALKASGQSIYRLAAPTVVASLILSGLVYVNQDYILPFTNPRQNNLRHLIRSGHEPPQTFYQTTNQWIFGADSRIYNYAHFDPTGNVFARLNIIELSKSPFGIKRRIYARRAEWDNQSREWVLQTGWERTFKASDMTSFESFRERRIELPEYPDHFRKDIRGSSSMTFGELRRKITDLSRAGFDVLDLRIALQTKIAFPLTCLVMVVVGLPFAFSVGRRGALYGVALGIGIGLTYWGLIGIFEQMGRYEVLPPLLAAWGPNLLFGAGGVYLFFTSRT